MRFFLSLLSVMLLSPLVHGEENCDPRPPKGFTDIKSIVDNMRLRLDEIRQLKEDGVVGETHDGYLAIVDENANLLQDPGYAASAQALIQEENATRDAYYEKKTARAEEEILRQTAEQLPELRQQVVKELCDRLQLGVLCESIADSVVDAALAEALKAANAATFTEIRKEIQTTHGSFFQKKGTRAGEWIEVEVSPGVYDWKRK